MKNAFRFKLKALFILKILILLTWRFSLVGKRFDKKTQVYSEIYDVTDWTENNGNAHIA